jgi:hypothetical protein
MTTLNISWLRLFGITFGFVALLAYVTGVQANVHWELEEQDVIYVPALS